MASPRSITPTQSPRAAALNEFCCALATLFPRVFVSGIISWAAYVLVVDIGIRAFTGFAAAAVSILGTVLYFLCILSYFLIVKYGAIGPARPVAVASESTSDSGRHSPSNSESDLESGTATLLQPAVLAKDNGKQRYCSKCRCWKPDRTHHCSTCKTCVLKMDHHCPWFSTCIGFANYKYFILFLFYVVMFSLISFLASGKAIMNWIDSERFVNSYVSLNWIFLFVVSIVFGLAVTIFFAYQVYLLFVNKTTIEAMEPQRYKSRIANGEYRYSEPPSSKSVGNVFDLGWRENFYQVMGTNPLLWFLPINNSKGDGTTFPFNIAVLNSIRRRADQESQMLSNLHGWLERNSNNAREPRPTNVVIGNEEDEYSGRVSVEFRPSDRRQG
ncbi:DHHC palmitoyltransferase-domain-containing protein [Limtongia smithiae]|uniref:DHHC palmitoyltransferase-domain-containing protein n=1 Tax=Limtongia smithiae TaxID=1125753 RepID=UPI0034CE4478